MRIKHSYRLDIRRNKKYNLRGENNEHKNSIEERKNGAALDYSGINGADADCTVGTDEFEVFLCYGL